MKLKILVTILFQTGVLFAQQVKLTEVCKLDKALTETSGVVVSGGKVWSHNDSGNEPVLYGFDKTGKVSSIIYVSGKNVDWEDITKDDAGNLYIGDFGNTNNKRHDLKIYKIPAPETLKENVAKPEVIQFKYSDQNRFPPDSTAKNYDMEAMVWMDNHLYLFSKNRTQPFTGYTRVYKLPAKAGVQIAELVDSVYLGPEPMITNWVTGAAISPDKTKLALLSHDKMWIFTCFTGDKFFSGKKSVLTFQTMTQKEAICFNTNNEIYITDELVFKVTGGRLYSLDLSAVKIEACK